MKSNILPRVLVSAAFLFCLLASGRAGSNPTPPKLPDLLATKGAKAIIYQPTQIKAGQTLLLTHTQFSRSTPKVGFQQAVEFVVYSSAADGNGDYPVLFTSVENIDAAGPGGGPHVRVLPGYTHPGGANQQGVICALIGLLIPVNDSTNARLTPLAANDAFTLDMNDSGLGFGLLVPAVQKVRATAAR